MLLSKSSVVTMGFGVTATVFFVGGLLLLCMGVLGEYLGRVYDEVRSRPLSIISSVHRAEAVMESQLSVVAKQSNGHRKNDVTDAA
jgi:dolichol-phosphate mannosyltransferase